MGARIIAPNEKDPPFALQSVQFPGKPYGPGKQPSSVSALPRARWGWVCCRSGHGATFGADKPTAELCDTTVPVTQNRVLVEPADIDHIAAAIRKVQAHGAQLART